MAFSTKQLGLLSNRDSVDNVKVRERLLAAIRQQETNRKAVADYNAGKREMDKILGEMDVEDDEPLDLVVAEGYVIRFNPRLRKARKGTPEGTPIYKTIWRTEKAE